MLKDLSILNVERVIIHEVLKQNLHDEKRPPIFSEIESDLNADLSIFIKDKIVETVGGSRSYDIIFEEETNSPIKDDVNKLLNESDFDFVSISKDITNHLNKIQSGRSPGGLVTVVIGNVGGVKIVGILKLEREEGARLQQIQKDGKPTYDILHIKDLILTEKTKLFKIGLFFQDDTGQYGYDGKVCDKQLSSSNKEVADFFLKSFLGCSLAGDPKVETKEFFNKSQIFINEEVCDPIVQTKYSLHLVSYISNNLRTINARRFAAQYLDEGHKQSYIDFLKNKKVKTTDIVRDTSLIEGNLKKMTLDFENGVRIIANQKDFEDCVKLEELENGNTKAEVRSKLKNVKT